MRIVKKIFFWFLLVFFLFILTGVGITYFYSDKVENLVVSALNEQLTRPVKFSNLEFSFFRKFPKASVEILDVQVAGVKKTDEPFIQTEKIYLSFDLFSLLDDDIVINEISVENATVNVEIDKKGKVNYEIFKSSGESKKSNILNIEYVHLVNVKLNYNDASSSIFIAAHSYNSSVKVSISEVKNISCKWSGVINTLQTAGQHYQNIPLEGNIAIAASKASINYELLNGKLNEATVSVKGKYNRLKGLNHSDFSFTTSTIKSIYPFIENDIEQDLKVLNKVSNLVLKGSISDMEKSRKLVVDFKLSGGQIAIENSENPIDVYLQGDLKWENISRNSTAIITMKALNLSAGESNLKGSGTLKDFDQLKVQLDLIGSVHLPSLMKSFPNSQLAIHSGTLNFDTKIGGDLKKIFSTRNFSTVNYIQSSGNIEVDNLSFNSQEIKDEFKAIFGKITFDKKRIILEDFKGKVNNSSFVLNGSVLDYVESIVENKELEISAGITIDQLALEEFINETASGTAATGYYFDLPAGLKLNLDFKLGSFTFRKFAAKDLAGNVKLQNKLLQLSNVRFLSCNGSSLLNGRVDASSENNLVFESKIKLSGIDVKKAFYQLENFGQEFLLDKHVSGTLSTDVYFKIISDKALNVNHDLLFVQADLTIDKGELTRFEPMMELEKFLKKEFKLSMALSDLKFSTLSNVIEISNQVIKIPEMHIASNGINLDVEGTHSFNQEINYLFKIKNGEIFKAKNKNKIDEKYGVIDNGDNTSTLPLLMTGTVDNPKFSYDFRTKKEIVKDNWKEQGKDVKAALKQEVREILGRDTVPKDVKSNTKIQVVWDDED